MRRRGVRLFFLLRRREARLKVVGVERWKEVVQATQQLERMKALSFERWRLFVLLRRVCGGWRAGGNNGACVSSPSTIKQFDVLKNIL